MVRKTTELTEILELLDEENHLAPCQVQIT